MDFFSGLKKAYDRIETEMSKSLSLGDVESKEDVEEVEDNVATNTSGEREPHSHDDLHSPQVCGQDMSPA